MTGGIPWTSPDYEGKVLRKLVRKLNLLLKGDISLDELIKLSHCISQVAQAKNSLAKTSEMQKDIDKIKDHLGIK